MNEEINLNLQNSNSNISILQKILCKENETLKLLNKDKFNNNQTLNSLLQILELQRERITCLEEENENINKKNIEYENKIRELEFKLNSRSLLNLSGNGIDLKLEENQKIYENENKKLYHNKSNNYNYYSSKEKSKTPYIQDNINYNSNIVSGIKYTNNGVSMPMGSSLDSINLNSIKSFSNFNLDEYENKSKNNSRIYSNQVSKINTPNGIDKKSYSMTSKEIKNINSNSYCLYENKNLINSQKYKFNINNNLQQKNSEILYENEFYKDYTPNNSRPNSRKKNLKPIIASIGSTPLYQSANINTSNSQYKI